MTTKHILSFLFLLSTISISFSQGGDCSTATPFCSDAPITFPASTNTTAQTGPNYGCLSSQPNPAWYYLQVDNSGNIQIDLTNDAGNGSGVDIDFAVWGPFADPAAACPPTNAPIDCSFSTAATEVVNIPSATAGDFYLMLITNYSGQATDITASTNSSSSGSTSCNVLEPIVDFSVSATTICINDSIDFTDLSVSYANGGFTSWSWDFGDGQTSTDQNPSNFFYPTPGTYTVTLTVTDGSNAGGGDTTKVGYITVNSCTVTPVAAFSVSPSLVICENDSIDFTDMSINIPPGSLYGWNMPGATPATSTSLTGPQDVYYANSGSYWVTLVITDPAFTVLDSIGKMITVNNCNMPVADFSFAPSGPFCTGDTLHFTNNSTYSAPATFAWDFGDGTSSTDENPSVPFNIAGNFNITLTVTDSEGSHSQSQAVNIAPCVHPTASFTLSDTVLCEGNCIFINNTTEKQDFNEWIFEGGNPAGSYLPYPGQICYDTAGVFDITLIVGNQYGRDTLTVQFPVNPQPHVTASEDQQIISSQEVEIEAVSNDPDITYTWSPAIDIDCLDCPITTVHPIDTTNYVITIENAYGCKDSADVLIEVEYIESIGVPTAFSPNQDGFNDTLMVYGSGITSMTLKIFNRLGQQVFITEDQKMGWDGTFNGQPLNTGVFAYYLVYSNHTEDNVVIKGDITLIR